MGTPLVLYGLALVVRLVLVALYPDPAYPDAFYYVDVARNLAAGKGFSADFIWIFAEVGGAIPLHPTLPIPSNAHWMPLAELIQVPFLWLLGPTAVASALPFALVGATVAPLAWLIARRAGWGGAIAGAAGILAAFPALLTPYVAQPDNFALFGPLVAGALFLAAQGLHGDGRAFAAAGLLAGVATLARTDGLLVAVALALVVLADRGGRWASRPRRPAIGGRAVLLAGVLYLVVVGPWFLRQLLVFGQLSPTGGKTLFIRSIAEWNSITTPADPSWLLAMGVWPLLETRIGGLVAAAFIAAVLLGALVLAPFWIVGVIRRRAAVDVGPYLIYAAVLFLFSGLVSAVHVPGGTFIHSAVALAPHGDVLAADGIAATAAWLARRLPGWETGRATRFLLTALVGTVVVAAAAAVPIVHAGWARQAGERQAVATALQRAGARPDDRLMSIDAAGYRYTTGLGGVVLVNDPLEVVGEVARAYGIRWLVVQRDDAVPAVAPVLLADQRPPWIGPAVWKRDAQIALYPVCVAPEDQRCSAAGARETP